jgi:hypothetical protein
MPDWLAFLFGVIAGALVLAGGLLYADMRRERRDRQALWAKSDAFARGEPVTVMGIPPSQQSMDELLRDVERQRGEGA